MPRLFALAVVLVALYATPIFSFNLRSDDKAEQSNVVEGAGSHDEDPAKPIHDAAEKFLTPAEKMIMKDKQESNKLALKYKEMQKRQSELRDEMEKRLKESATPENMAKQVQEAVAAVSGKEFLKFKGDINAIVDRVYELLKPKLEETCTNLGFAKSASSTGSATGSNSPQGATGEQGPKNADQGPGAANELD